MKADEFDVITGTMDGGCIWRRYGDGKIIATRPDETPQQALERIEREEGGDEQSELQKT